MYDFTSGGILEIYEKSDAVSGSVHGRGVNVSRAGFTRPADVWCTLFHLISFTWNDLICIKCRHLALIGDHCQLPPVIISPLAQKGGLARSLFERLREEDREFFSAPRSVQEGDIELVLC
jgi:hypothetical protein